MLIQYQVDGITFFLNRSVEEGALDKNKYRHNLLMDQVGEPWFLWLRDLTRLELAREIIRLQVKLNKDRTESQGLLRNENHGTHFRNYLALTMAIAATVPETRQEYEEEARARGTR